MTFFRTRNFHLPLANHVHQFDARQDTGGSPKRFETHYGFCDSLYRSMILLHDVVEILNLSNYQYNFFVIDDLVDR